MLGWVKKQAEAQNLSPAACCGYITFDEMLVQVSIHVTLMNITTTGWRFVY